MAGIRITDKPTRSTIDKIVGVREQGNTEVALIGVDDLAEQLLAGEIGQEIEGAASGLVQATSWPVLNGISGTRVGQPGRVPNQAGTHTDPVTSDTVNNQADYNWTGSAWTWTNDYVDFSAEIDTKLDNTTTALATLMGSAAGKTTPADNDSFAARDSADDFALTKFSWANIKETLDIDSKQDASANLDDWSDISANELFARPSVEEGAYLALLDDDGVGERFGTGGVFLADDGESIEVAAGWKIGRGDGDGDIIVFDPDTGIAAVLGKPNPDPIVDAGTGGTVAGNLFSDERNEYVEGRALAEALRLNSQDM
ncbi:MAG TPA: hypothetical protein VL202_22295, partial [Pararhizobium sp.]|nr:hypothetical protein [Pararhizobium sp.]